MSPGSMLNVLMHIIVIFVEIWKDHAEAMEISKLQQQFSDLKQWRLEEESRAAESESDSEETGSQEDLGMHNAFSLLEQED